MGRTTRDLVEARLSLLRRAALSPPEAARAAWHEWADHVDPWRHDPGSRWWFPLIWWNLRDQPLTPDARRLLRQDYTAAWMRYHHHAPFLASLLADLDQLGVATMLLKGAALAQTAYDRPALRPFGDIDILVKPSDAERARRKVERRGWVPVHRVPVSLVGLKPSMNYVDARGIDIDLHQYALAECTAPTVDDGFWRRSVVIEFGGAPTRALSPADQLLHVCIHGLRYAPIRTDHWIADAIAILRRAGGAFDWDLCIAEARHRSLTVQLLHALERIRADDASIVPERIPSIVRGASARWWERFEYRAKRGASHAGIAMQSWCVASRSRRMGQRGSFFRAGTGHLQAAASTEGMWRLIGREALSLAGRPRRTRHTFVAFGRCVHIASDLEGRMLRDTLQRRLPVFPLDKNHTPPDRTYEVMDTLSAAPALYRVLVNRAPLAATATLEEAIDLLVGDLQAFLAAAANGRTFLHAGAVVFDGGAVILPGVSGSGKSTLVAALLRAGAEYLSDEFAVIDDQALVHPYARPLRLRGIDGRDTRISAKSLGATLARRASPVRAVLFADFDPCGPLRFQRLSASHALVRLLNHAPGAQARPEATMATLRTLVMSAPAWAASRGEADEAAAAIREGALTAHARVAAPGA